MRRLSLILRLSVACLLTVRCSSSGGDITDPTAVETVRVTPAGATIGVGQTAAFTAEALNADDVVLTGRSFSFSSSNTTVATVQVTDANPATVTGVAAGSATITATTEGKSGMANLTVQAQPDIQVTGRVVDGETGVGIANAGVDYEASMGMSRSTVTAGDGSFSFLTPFIADDPGVIVTARAPGYVSTTLVWAAFPPATQLETILLVRQTSTPGAIFGAVRNARNNEGIGAAEVELRSGQGLNPGPPESSTTSDPGGTYSFTGLAAGTYTVRASTTGFTTGQRTAITVLSGTIVAQDVILSPLGSNEIRIVLTWGSNPSDLDSHLTGPNPDASRFHVYYEPGSRGTLTAPPFAALDLDDTDSFGPETITITRFSSGTYRYSVHDFSNRSSATSTALGTSRAKVELYTPGAPAPLTYFVPNQRGTLWTVFELSGDIARPTITNRNTMGLAEDPSGVLVRAPLAAEGGKGGEADAGLIGRALRALPKTVRR